MVTAQWWLRSHSVLKCEALKVHVMGPAQLFTKLELLRSLASDAVLRTRASALYLGTAVVSCATSFCGFEGVLLDLGFSVGLKFACSV